ncbi:hypothetical protein CMI37_32205 [Candidatus Pacearchaeota archaeon]|nr:hypothetical protein [Candidatus Pacearchaeota archaeon]|tara:strand:- start:8365 stop:8874 length:510 start_codon:yes stop_codon:yes gene_type:complete
MAIINCKICGTKKYFRPSAIKRGGGKFCSRKCYSYSIRNIAAWNRGLKNWRTKEHSEKLNKAIIKRNKKYPTSSKQAKINGSKAKTPKGSNHYKHKPNKNNIKCPVVYISGRGNVKLSILTAEANIGERLKPNEIVHHLDGNVLNNDWRNLLIMTRAEHSSFHNKNPKL